MAASGSRRWSASQATTKRDSPLVEPSTYGTSWNSVRWRKPTSAFSGHSSRVATAFERPSSLSYSLSPSKRTPTSVSPASRRAAEIISYGPSVSSRASRFDATVSTSAAEKYRNEARELLSKYSSRERPAVDYSWLSKKNDYTFATPVPKTAEYRDTFSSSRKSYSSTPTRTSAFSPTPPLSALGRYSASYERPSATSTSSFASSLTKERPWRTRLRHTMGEASTTPTTSSYLPRSGARSRRNSLSQASGDDLATALSAVRNYVASPPSGSKAHSRTSSFESTTGMHTPSSRFTYRSPSSYFSPMSSSYTSARETLGDRFKSSYMSRSYSPVRSPASFFTSPSSREISPGTRLTHNSSHESLGERGAHVVSTAPKAATIRESSHERDGERRKRSSTRERTARRESRQRSAESSSDDEAPSSTNSKPRKRRTRKRSDVLSPTSPAAPEILSKGTIFKLSKTKSLTSAVYDPAVEAVAEGSPRPPPLLPSPSLGDRVGDGNTASLEMGLRGSKEKKKQPDIVETAPSPVVGLEALSVDTKCLVAEGVPSQLSAASSSPSTVLSPTASERDDESQYSAIAHFFRAARKKSPAPVPGLWQGPAKEICISSNKHLRRIGETVSVSRVWTPKTKARISKTLQVVPPRPPPPKPREEPSPARAKEETKESPPRPPPPALKDECAAAAASDEKKTSRFLVGRKRKERQPSLETASLTKDFTYKKRLRLGVERVFRLRRVERDSFACSAAMFESSRCKENLVRPTRSGSAQVTVLRPERALRAARASLSAKAPREATPPTSILPLATEEKEEQKKEETPRPLARSKAIDETVEEVPQVLPPKDSRAAVLLERLREESGPPGSVGEEEGPLVLPDKSLLEEYVRRRKKPPERLQSEPIVEDEERDSPCLSTTSELLPAAEVRVNAPLCGVPEIRRASRASLTPSAMLDTQPQPSFNNFNSTPAAFLRSNRSASLSKPLVFDTPKTPFEERMQSMAKNLRRASIASTVSEGDAPLVHNASEGDVRQRVREAPEGGSSISCGFAAAVASASAPREQRYAAHLPVRDGRESGRLSTTSIDSTNSGALDAASKQLEQVIDAARHKHHQHRSKFKEAIDYLDQIFEDLKKECEPERKAPPSEEERDPDAERPRRGSVKAATARLQTAISEEGDAKRLPAEAVEMPVTSQPLRSSHADSKEGDLNATLVCRRASPPAPLREEVDVVETFVLPRRVNKRDYTQKWLAGEASLASEQPKPDLLVGPDMSSPDEGDDRSVGSCSAEVAAINSSKKKAKRQTPDLIQNVDQKAKAPRRQKETRREPPPQPLVRPQPQRPQPVYALPSSSGFPEAASTLGYGAFPLHLDSSSLAAPQPLPRVSSFERVPRGSQVWRGASQEPQPEFFQQRSGAFTNYDPSKNMPTSGFRGSMQSLPDPLLFVRPQPFRGAVPDPALTIDALVAELELNTEEGSQQEKRRSFPIARPLPPESLYASGGASSRSRRPVPPQQQPQPQPRRLPASTSNPVGFTQPQFSGGAPRTRTSRSSFDEVASMLDSVTSDLASSAQPAPVLRRKPQPMNAVFGMTQPSPFETINSERLNPSRVEAFQQLFEGRHPPGLVDSRRVAPPARHREEDTYFEISDFTTRHRLPTPPRTRASPQEAVFVPQPPPSQPPPYFPPGSATSSQNGGYYSSNSSGIGPSYPLPSSNRRGSIVGRLSLSSRAPSVDDAVVLDDDDVYDNIGNFGHDERRYSRDFDAASMQSGRPPISGSKTTKIGSFLRKIGGSRPPGSAASLVSLNKVVVESPQQSRGGLVKSSSLSGEPWKKNVMATEKGERPGLGSRLKNSLFGSKKKLNSQ